jgi:hypothetical protein
VRFGASSTAEMGAPSLPKYRKMRPVAASSKLLVSIAA